VSGSAGHDKSLQTLQMANSGVRWMRSPWAAFVWPPAGAGGWQIGPKKPASRLQNQVVTFLIGHGHSQFNSMGLSRTVIKRTRHHASVFRRRRSQGSRFIFFAAAPTMTSLRPLHQPAQDQPSEIVEVLPPNAFSPGPTSVQPEAGAGLAAQLGRPRASFFCPPRGLEVAPVWSGTRFWRARALRRRPCEPPPGRSPFPFLYCRDAPAAKARQALVAARL